MWQKWTRMSSVDEIRTHFTKHRKLARPLFAAGLLLLALPFGVEAKSEEEVRYPFDPACPWGRLSNGKGMIHRCLTQGEAEDLARKDESAKAPVVEKKTDEKAAVNAEAEKKAKPSPPREYNLDVGPIEADKGEISIGRLDKPLDRYRQCIDTKGGLSDKNATVVVKFLVRGEQQLAEGVSVDSFKGVSKAAADCIAEVVDRRKVGAPSAPLTGARLTFSIQGK